MFDAGHMRLDQLMAKIHKQLLPVRPKTQERIKEREENKQKGHCEAFSALHANVIKVFEGFYEIVKYSSGD